MGRRRGTRPRPSRPMNAAGAGQCTAWARPSNHWQGSRSPAASVRARVKPVASCCGCGHRATYRAPKQRGHSRVTRVHDLELRPHLVELHGAGSKRGSISERWRPAGNPSRTSPAAGPAAAHRLQKLPPPSEDVPLTPGMCLQGTARVGPPFTVNSYSGKQPQAQDGWQRQRGLPSACPP